ncbi:MAG: hemerythrin domain-containing protein [Bdellovibrionaceae bacterium]|jgi:hemerythrin-like domain-containing protein|nr:hemerythrin domain-containing protein [Pseudobdellovibrionaceae bacterium]
MDMKKDDPVKKNVEKNSGGEELSPMDPPSAMDPPNIDEIPKADRHIFLQRLMEEHEELTKELNNFEKAITEISEKGVTKEADRAFRHFFHFFDQEVLDHQKKEEKELFPILAKRLPPVEGVYPGSESESLTPVEIMEDDHLKIIQLVAVVFNFFGLASRMKDPTSRVMVLDAAIEQGKSLVELLRLHMFREDNVVFVLAHQNIDKELFDRMNLH